MKNFSKKSTTQTTKNSPVETEEAVILEDKLKYLSEIASLVENKNIVYFFRTTNQGFMIYKNESVMRNNSEWTSTTGYPYSNYNVALKNLMYEYKYSFMQKYEMDEEQYEMWIRIK
jgi:hypothetical protein